MKIKNKSKLVCVVGTNDLTIKGNEAAYSKWTGMLTRCYNPKYHVKKPTYKGCSVCDEWLTFSKFKAWYDLNNRVGMELDKDILVRGNKIYSPEFCRFVPKEINTLLLTGSKSTNPNKLQGAYGPTKNGSYVAKISKNSKLIYLGTEPTELLAHLLYKMVKEQWINDLANHYYSLGQIDSDLYTALLHWNI